MVQRYDPWRGVDESETGEFVTYLDYATLESENAKMKDELAAAQEAHALDRAPMLRAMTVFDEGADDERWTPGVHVVDALIADHANLRDLLRRVRGCFRNGETPATIAIELSTLMPEIKSAIEPSGEPGEREKS